MTILVMVSCKTNSVLEGPKGDVGEPGKSVYELYLENYPSYNKTEKEQLDDLISGNLTKRLPKERDYILDFYPLNDGDEYGVKVGKSAYLKNVVIPSTYNGRPISTILSMGFRLDNDYSDLSEKSRLETIFIPNSITGIESYAFD